MSPLHVPDYELGAAAGWPAPPAEEVYVGVAGSVAASVAPHTEADPVAVLTQLLVAAGSAVGRGAYVVVEATRHYPNEFLVLVGDSAKARKGSSWDHVMRVVEAASPGFERHCSTGLSSGEGLIWALRDPDGNDAGATDPRLLVVEPEFASVLKALARDISTLSPVLRSAWDGRPLALLTRSAPARASTPHLSVIGHITAAELRHHVSGLEVANGLLNRFCLVACRRARLLPEGGDPDPLADTGLPERLATNLARARSFGHVRFTAAARDRWWDAYGRLSEPGTGLVGGLLARAEAHVLRLSLLYALCDGRDTIRLDHLDAALALWDYVTHATDHFFKEDSGEPLAEEISAALARSPDGMTRSEIRDLFWRNRPAVAIDEALATLRSTGRADVERVRTAGRPALRWSATAPAGP